MKILDIFFKSNRNNGLIRTFFRFTNGEDLFFLLPMRFHQNDTIRVDSFISVEDAKRIFGDSVVEDGEVNMDLMFCQYVFIGKDKEGFYQLVVVTEDPFLYDDLRYLLIDELKSIIKEFNSKNKL